MQIFAHGRPWLVVALVLLGIPPLLAGAYAGVANVDRQVVDAAEAMGMKTRQVLLRVEVPNALPLILGGLRSATLQVIATATVAAYVRWTEGGGRRWAWTCAACFVLGALSDWPIFYLVPIMGVHAWLSGRARVVQIGVLSCATAGLFALLAWWTAWSGGDVSVFHQFAVRTSRTGITLRGWFERVIVHHQGMLHTWPVLALSAIYVARLARRAAAGDRPAIRDSVLPMLLLAWGVVNLAIGIDGNYRHEWWSMMLTPGLAMTAALGLEAVIRTLPPRLRVARIAAPLAVAAIVVFLAISARAAMAFTRYEWFRGDGYTLEGLGRIIARVATPDEAVLTTVRTDHPALWFYADRQLRVGVTSPAALDAALAPGPYVVFYDYVQPYGPAPTWLVMPLADRKRYPNLAAALDARFRREDRGAFSIFRLR